MDTKEHTDVGNALRLQNKYNNPYLRIDDKGVMHIQLQRLEDKKNPETVPLELSTGQIVAMAADYFTQADWIAPLDLPHCEVFRSPADLGKYLIGKRTTPIEEDALLTAYNNLAAPNVTQKDIDRIYNINSSNYLPFSRTLNGYVQQIMLYFRVTNYGEMITRNLTHFTPWSVKAYMLGHAIALRYAKLSSELKKLAATSDYQSTNEDLVEMMPVLDGQTPENLVDLSHRYEALAYGMELFTFHYYTDHFATGHMSMMADLRTELQTRFGTLGSILANNLHDEINRVGVFTNHPYDTNPSNDAPTRSRGDNRINTCLNQRSRRHCIQGMSESFKDIDHVLAGGELPQQRQYGGLKYLPDVDFNVRQHEPLLVFSNGKIYRREHPSKIKVLAPSEYDGLRADPTSHGYVEVSNKADAFGLVCKLRLFPYFYNGKVLPVPPERKEQIKHEEKSRAPKRHSIRNPKCKPESEPNALDWRTQKDWKDHLDQMDGLKKHSVLRFKKKREAVASSHKPSSSL